MENLVSIIIPTLNSTKTLEKCLSSIKANNSRYSYELIVIDGSSTDETISIAKKYADKVLVEDTYFRGVNRNKGIRNSRGEIICFTDSDCTVPENWINALVEGLIRLNKENNKVVGVGGGNVPWIENPSFMERAIALVIRSPLVAFGSRNVTTYTVERQVYHNPPMNSAYFKWALEKVGGFGEEINIGEDVELDLKIAEEGYKLYYLPNILVQHRHRTAFRKFAKQMYDFGKTRLRLVAKFKTYAKLNRFGRLYHWGPLMLCLMIIPPFTIVPLGMALVNSVYICLKHRTWLSFFLLAFLTMSFYITYGSGELAYLIRKK